MTFQPRRAAALLLFCLAGCNVPGARIHNLKELHEDTGRHARNGNLAGAFEYYIRFGASDLFGDRLAALSDGGEETLKNPLQSCVKNLTALGRIESEDQRVTAAQVAMLSWLAIDDPWKLSREACVRALGEHGERLGVAVPPPRQEPPAAVEQVRAALAALVAAVRTSGPLQAVEGEELPFASALESPLDLEAACAAIEALDLDRSGGLRLLRGVGALASGMSLSDARTRRLLRTLEHLQGTCVAEALLSALKDGPPREVGGSHPGWGSDRVRAAAVTACVRAFGDDALGELLLQLDRERSEEVVRAVLRAVAKYGLPEPNEEVPEASRPRLIQRWVDMILLHAYDNPSGQVRVAAMRALSRISGGELDSLREEDWQAWQLERDAALAEASAGAAETVPEPGSPSATPAPGAPGD